MTLDNKSLKRIFLVFTLTLFLIGNAGVGIVHATSLFDSTWQTTSSACFSLDVVFLLDQSSSMSGGNGADANDPTEQRIYASQWAIDWLTDNALDICAQAIHRIAVISFGNQAYLDLPLSNIDPSNQTEAQRIRERLKTHILPKDLGETNPQLAFQMAEQVLDNAAPIGNTPRKRVIIFITDGHPCVEKLGCVHPNSTMDFVGYARDMVNQVASKMPFDETLLKQEQCLSEARATYGVNAVPAEVSNKCLSTYLIDTTNLRIYDKSTYIWTLLLKHDLAYSIQLRDEYERMSDSHAGQVINLTENRADIPSTFLDILSQLAGVKAQRLSCGNFAVNPYLRQMRLVFFKVDNDTKVTLSYVDAAGNTHLVENGQGDTGITIAEHDASGPNERYVIDNPYPGLWHFTSDDCSGISAYYEPLEMSVGGAEKPMQILAPDGIGYYLDFTNLVITKPADPEHLRANDKFYLQYTIRDNNGTIIKQAEPPIFAIQFNVNVTDPKGGKESYDMEWLPEQQLFRSKSWLKFQYQGEYVVNLSGETSNRESPYGPINDPVATTVFNTKRHLFDYAEKFSVVCSNIGSRNTYPWPEDISHDADGCDVLPIRNYDFKITEPNNNDNVPIHGTIIDGWPLPIHPIDFVITLVDAQGKDLLPDDVFTNIAQPFGVTITVGNQTVDVAYKQDLNNPARYIGEITNVNTVGKYVLTANLTSDDAKFYEPLNRTAKQTFNLRDTFWTTSSTYYMLLALLICIAIASLTYSIMITNNKVNGTLVFRAGNTVIHSFSLRGGKNWKDISSRELARYPELDLARLRVTSLPKKKATRRNTSHSDSEFSEMSSVSTNGLNLDHPGVSVSGRTRSRHPINKRLQSRIGENYSAETEANMEYYPPGEYDGE